MQYGYSCTPPRPSTRFLPPPSSVGPNSLFFPPPPHISSTSIQFPILSIFLYIPHDRVFFPSFQIFLRKLFPQYRHHWLENKQGGNEFCWGGIRVGVDSVFGRGVGRIVLFLGKVTGGGGGLTSWILSDGIGFFGKKFF